MKRLLLLAALLPGIALAQLPLNEFVKMDATFNAGRSVSTDLDTDSAEPDFRSFSSIEATDDGRLIYWGGGHGDYGGNDMDVYDISENEWYQPTEEENWKNRLRDCWAQNPTPDAGHPCEDVDHPARTAHLGQTWDVGGTQPTADEVSQTYGSGGVRDYLTGRGRPGTRHVYQQATWWPEKGWFVFDFKHGLWAWDPKQGDSNSAFQEIYDGRVDRGYADIQHWNVRYDPPSGTLISINSADSDVWQFKDGDWVEIVESSTLSKGEVFSEYHEADGVHYVSRSEPCCSTPDTYILDVEAQTFTPIAQSPPSTVQKPGTNHSNDDSWMEYSPSREQMIVMGFGPDGLGVWGHNPDTDTWEEIPMTGTVNRANGTPITEQDIRWDMLEYDPVSGNFFFLALDLGDQQGVPLYAFRLDSNAGDSTSGADPSQYSNNQWVEQDLPSGPSFPTGNGKDFQMEFIPEWGDLFVGFGDWQTGDTSGSSGREHMYRVDMENNSWTVLQGHCPTELHQDGWDELITAYDSTRGHLWGFPGFTWDDGCGGGNKNTMYWDVATESWNDGIGGKLITGDGFFGDYDAETDRVWGGHTSGAIRIDHTLRDDPNTTEDEFADNALTFFTPTNSSEYRVKGKQVALDRKGRALYMVNHDDGKRAIIKFDIEDKTYSGPEFAPIPTGWNIGNANMVWNPKHRVFMFPHGKCDTPSICIKSGEMHVYHVDTGQWEYHDYSYIGEDAPTGNSTGYDEDNELLLLMGQRDGHDFHDVYVIQYDPQATGVDESWITGEQVSGTGSPLDIGGTTPSGGTITVTIRAPVDVEITQQNRVMLIDAPQGWGVEIVDTDNPGTVISQTDGPDFGVNIVDVTVDDPAGQDASYTVRPGRALIRGPQNIAMEIQ